MAIVTNYDINKTNIKFRWGEPFASKASNIQMGVNLEGAYRGGIVQQNGSGSAANKTIWVNIGDSEDSVILHRDPATGFCAVVRLAGNIQLDLGGETWPIPGGGKKYYVYVDVDFAENVQTAGAINVSDVQPTLSEVAMLAMLDLPAGATEITQAMIRTDGTNRNKVGRKKYVLAKRRVDIPAEADRVSFQLSGKICYMGDGANDFQRSKISLHQPAGQGFRPLVGDNGGLISAGSWRATETGGSLGISDMDEDGCFIDPWIVLNFSDTDQVKFDGALVPFYYEAVPFDEWVVAEEQIGFFGGHALDISCADATATPDSLTQANLSAQLTQILNLINSRIRTYNPEDKAGDTTWNLLWRSNNIVSDDDVTDDTISIYFCSRGMAVVYGGVLEGSGLGESTVTMKTETAFCRLEMQYSDSSISAKGVTITGPTTLAVDTENQWEFWEKDGRSDFYHYDQGGVVKDYQFWDPVILKLLFSGGSDYVEIFEHNGMRLHLYIKGTTTSSRFYLVHGATWNAGDNEWNVQDGIGNVTLVGFETGELVFKKKWLDLEDGWTDLEWDYTTTLGLMTQYSRNFDEDGNPLSFADKLLPSAPDARWSVNGDYVLESLITFSATIPPNYFGAYSMGVHAQTDFPAKFSVTNVDYVGYTLVDESSLADISIESIPELIEMDPVGMVMKVNINNENSGFHLNGWAIFKVYLYGGDE